MNEYYLVKSTFYDNGKIKTSMHIEPYDKKPENYSSNTEEYDIHYDWFDKYEDALKYKNDCINA